MGDDKTIRWDIYTGPPVKWDNRPVVWITGFPPLPGESTDEYGVRVLPLMIAADRKHRPWWAFWR